jgi:hypothetical protein
MVLRRPEAGHNLHMTTPLVAAESLRALGSSDRRLDAYASHEIALGALTVSRALPVKGRRMIGPWCFLDRFGPLSFTAGLPMDVAPHPHMGLQTVTWLLEGLRALPGLEPDEVVGECVVAGNRFIALDIDRVVTRLLA